MNSGTLVVAGVGGVGLACVRRMGSGRQVILADRSPAQLSAGVDALRAEGFEVTGQQVDVTSSDDLAALAEAAGDAVMAVVHTAGVSPAQASTAEIFRVDLLGVALAIDAWAPVLSSGSVFTVIASMAGRMAASSPALERTLATASCSELLAAVDETCDPATAYLTAKRGAQLRVEAATAVFGRRGARINSVSPGVIATPMGAAELGSDMGEFIQSMIDTSPAGRICTAQDVAAAVAFLSSPEAGQITGTDLLVDGGTVATRWES